MLITAVYLYYFVTCIRTDNSDYIACRPQNRDLVISVFVHYSMVAAGTDGNKIFVGPGINVLIAAGPGIDFDGVGPGFAINFMRTAVYSNLVVSFFSINIMFGSAVYRDYIPVKPSGNPLAVSRAFLSPARAP